MSVSVMNSCSMWTARASGSGLGLAAASGTCRTMFGIARATPIADAARTQFRAFTLAPYFYRRI
jgi:hypothetical protein